MSAYAILDALAGLIDAPIAMAAAVGPRDDVEEAYDFAKEDSRFEFGSLTKTMTAQVLAALVGRGVVALDAPIGTWLDAGLHADITLGDLARHASGLPRVAPNALDHDGYDTADPYAAYTAALAEAGLRASERAEPSQYSNFGYQLLGLCLERAASTPFADLLRADVFDPFGMATASVGPGPNQVQGYRGGRPTPAWTMVLPGPGGVNGTLADLVAWGRSVTDQPNLGWGRFGDSIVWHNGGTYGAHASLFVDVHANRLAATLIATGDLHHVDDATLVACQGGDPFDTRPASVGDAYDRRVVEFFELLVAHDWETARARMSTDCAAALTSDRIAGAWHELMTPRGAYRSTTVTGATRHGVMVEVTVELAFAAGDGKGILHFNEADEIIGVRIA